MCYVHKRQEEVSFLRRYTRAFAHFIRAQYPYQLSLDLVPDPCSHYPSIKPFSVPFDSLLLSIDRLVLIVARCYLKYFVRSLSVWSGMAE